MTAAIRFLLSCVLPFAGVMRSQGGRPAAVGPHDALCAGTGGSACLQPKLMRQHIIVRRETAAQTHVFSWKQVKLIGEAEG